MARRLVVRPDGLAVLCDCSDDEANKILSKNFPINWRMNKARFRWLHQHGHVIDVKSPAFNKNMAGVYTPEEFYMMYEEAVKKNIVELKTVPYFPAVKERMISEMIVVLLKLSYFMSKRIERKKRVRDGRAVKLVEVSNDIIRYNKKKAKIRYCNGAYVLDFSKSFWILYKSDGSIRAIVVKKDATDEEIFDDLTKIIEREPEIINVIHNIKCELEDGQLKDKLAMVLSAISLLTS